MTTGVHQGLVLGLMPFNTVISHISRGIDCTLRGFADDTEKRLFYAKGVEALNSLPREVMGAPSMKTFRIRPEGL